MIKFWVRVVNFQIVCVKCAGKTDMHGWIAANESMQYKMFGSQNIRCSVCGVFQ